MRKNFPTLCKIGIILNLFRSSRKISSKWNDYNFLFWLHETIEKFQPSICTRIKDCK